MDQKKRWKYKEFSRQKPNPFRVSADTFLCKIVAFGIWMQNNSTGMERIVKNHAMLYVLLMTLSHIKRKVKIGKVVETAG